MLLISAQRKRKDSADNHYTTSRIECVKCLLIVSRSSDYSTCKEGPGSWPSWTSWFRHIPQLRSLHVINSIRLLQTYISPTHSSYPNPPQSSRSQGEVSDSLNSITRLMMSVLNRRNLTLPHFTFALEFEESRHFYQPRIIFRSLSNVTVSSALVSMSAC